MAVRRPRLLFLVGEDWYFWQHRLDLARAAQDRGFSVIVATRVRDYGKKIEDEGFKLLPIHLVRGSRRPVRELTAVVELIRIYRRERPDIVHHIGLKPVIYGAWAARATGVPSMVSMFAGLGHVFSADDLQVKLIRLAIEQALRYSLRHPNCLVIFQNPEDRDQLVRERIVQSGHARVIRGSGVDVSKFIPLAEVQGDPVVVLASRMLWDKGVGEFVEAARLLMQRGIRTKCVLVGRVDMENTVGIAGEQLLAWQKEGVIQWWGYREDMPHVFASAHVVVLPTYYGEGVPKVLLEAAACGRPIVATRVRGCREIVRDGDNGVLVPPRDPDALAQAIARLVRDQALRVRMGARGRQIAVDEFSVEKVARETLAVYQELIGNRWPVCAKSAV